jgi:hypothetical protein
MPEASVHKHGDLFVGENKVWAPKYRIMPTPTNNLMPSEQSNYHLLCGFVSGGFYLSHDPRAFLLANSIHELVCAQAWLIRPYRSRYREGKLHSSNTHTWVIRTPFFTLGLYGIPTCGSRDRLVPPYCLGLISADMGQLRVGLRANRGRVQEQENWAIRRSGVPNRWSEAIPPPGSPLDSEYQDGNCRTE